MIDKNKITVTMSLAEYEDLTTDIEWWRGRFNSLKKVVLKYAKRRDDDGVYVIDDCRNLANDIEIYLNDEDF